MFSVRKIFRAANFIFLATAFSHFVSAQDAVYGEDGIDVLYTNTSDGSIFAHSQGGGISFSYGKYRTAFKTRSFNADLLYIKHEREERTSNPVYIDGLPYVYGKTNSFLNLRLAMEHKWELTPKLRKSAVAVNHLARYGFSLGMLKPVYLEIGYPEIPYDYVVRERYSPNDHFYDDIYGRAAWVNGLDQLSIVPGFHVCYALNFEYSEVRGSRRTVEIGGVIDYFMSDVEIMAREFVEPQKLFGTIYLKMGIGANWTQPQ